MTVKICQNSLRFRNNAPNNLPELLTKTIVNKQIERIDNVKYNERNQSELEILNRIIPKSYKDIHNRVGYFTNDVY